LVHEKTTEQVFNAALRWAEKEWEPKTVEDYTTTESTNIESLPGSHNASHFQSQ
jgi:hypothetical protein